MKFVADLHIHSKYARATSEKMVLEQLSFWAKLKGVQILGTGDFTHPGWFRELKEKLVSAEPGLFVYKDDPDIGTEKATRFMLTAETSHIYTKNGKGRRVHILIWAPSFEAVEKINTRLSWGENLSSDGRPILGIDVKELAKIVFDAEPNCMVIPAHAWTPWFSVFGSMSGFDSLEECFDELTPQIYAIETGISSDPAMNWRLSRLDNISLVSNSDSHSLPRIGREANVFELKSLSYQAIVEAIKSKDPKRFLYTIELYPEKGRYHYDGHRLCHKRLSPEQTRKNNGLCPVCKKPVTIGVMYRVEQLADRPVGYKPENLIPYKNIIPLDEVIAESFGLTTKTKKVSDTYEKLCRQFGGEINILLALDLSELRSSGYEVLSEAIRRVRSNEIYIEPGYDNEYGVVHIFKPNEQDNFVSQTSLF